MTDKEILCLFTFFLLNIFIFYLWITIYPEYIPLYDQLYHLRLTEETFERIRNGEIFTLFKTYGGKGKFINFNLPFLFFSLFYPFFGFSKELFLVGNCVLINVSVLLLFIISKKLGLKNSFLPSLFFLTTSSIYWLSKFFFLEIIAIPFLLLSFYFLLLSKNFNVTKYSVLYGLLGAITILIKNSTIIPLTFLHFFAARNFLKKRWTNFLIPSIFLFFSIFSYFFLFFQEEHSLIRTTFFSPLLFLKFCIIFPIYLFIQLGPILFFLLILSYLKARKKLEWFFPPIFISYFVLYLLPLLYIPLPSVKNTIFLLPFFSLFIGKYFFLHKRSYLILLSFSLLLYLFFDITNFLMYKYGWFTTQLNGKIEEYSTLQQNWFNYLKEESFFPWISFTGEERGFEFNFFELKFLLLNLTHKIQNPKCFVFSFAVKDALEYISKKLNYPITLYNAVESEKIEELINQSNCILETEVEIFFVDEKFSTTLSNLSQKLEMDQDFKNVGIFEVKKGLKLKLYVKE